MNERIKDILACIRVNEQIERLAEQAGCKIDKLGYGEGNLEKFAELIIKECAAMTRNLSPHRELAEKAVKEHFGVE